MKSVEKVIDCLGKKNLGIVKYYGKNADAENSFNYLSGRCPNI